MNIDIENLKKRYGKHEVLKGLNLSIHEGETLVILGRSGVGKSVLLRQIIGLESPDAGTIRLDGHDLNSLSPDERLALTKEMGMLFQGGALFDSMDVFSNIAFYQTEHRTHSRQEIEKIVVEALAMVNLSDALHKMPSELSGGMRKRVALARVIAYKPRVILYDEPTTGLDPISARQINELIRKTQEELKATSVVVTHDIRSALFVGDRLAFHDDGVIQHLTVRNEFLKINDPQLHAFFENAGIKELP